jgi:hypothetical protein
LDEALALAHELKNPNLIAQTLRFQADRFHYLGDRKRASDLGQQASQAAQGASDRTLALLAQAETAMQAGATQPTRPLAVRLGELAQEADMRGLKSLSVECLVERTDVLRKLGDADAALREAVRALARAESLGLKVPSAKAHFVKAAVLRGKGDPAARSEYAATLRALEEIKADNGNENVLKRADLASMHAEALQFSK